jgi:Na+-transporting NADH:ubiquinone oxidoreductase subunit F
MKVMRVMHKLHKWASLVVGLQVLIWIVSGLFFSLMDNDKSRGQQYRQRSEAQINMHTDGLLPAKQILQQQSRPSQSLALIERLDQPYYLLTHQKGLYPHFVNQYSLVNAYSGETQIIDNKMAGQLAQASYNGPGSAVAINQLSPPIDDLPKQQNALWQVNFNDSLNTSVYIEVGSGRVAGHSNDDKRFADFFFMLHFMDYAGAGHFNNWPVMFFAIVCLWLCLTGLLWTIELGLKGRYKLTFSRQ